LAEAINNIETELSDRIADFNKQKLLIEAQRIEQRTKYDLEMLREIGFTSGIENYSRHLDGRSEGEPPWTLIDYFPSNFLLVIDESHMTIPQVRGMYAGDRSRKQTLVDYGFRLPSALDNRPLNFDEFEGKINQAIFTSATPGPHEGEHAITTVHQVIRPTGVLDPQIEVRPVRGQVDDLLGEINKRTEKGQRVLVTTLTKRMAEDLADYLLEMGVKVHYIHSEVHTIERTEILRDLRMGIFDVVVGINLLREGLDLPEVSLVAILDADKEGFLRSETALTQTIGRAARHIEGKVIMYAERITNSMERAIETTNERRIQQMAYNKAHGITPRTIEKRVRDMAEDFVQADEGMLVMAERGDGYGTTADLPKAELQKMINDLEKEMKRAAQALEFERAAQLRDQVVELRQMMVMKEAGIDPETPEWERERKLRKSGLRYDVD
jgi:excinuclease ABC subunit B